MNDLKYFSERQVVISLLVKQKKNQATIICGCLAECIHYLYTVSRTQKEGFLTEGQTNDLKYYSEKHQVIILLVKQKKNQATSVCGCFV